MEAQLQRMSDQLSQLVLHVGEVRQGITRLQEEMSHLNQRMDTFQAEIRADMDTFKAEVRSDIAKLNDKVDKLDGKFDWLSGKVDHFTHVTSRDIGAVGVRFENLAYQTSVDRQADESRLIQIETRLDRIEALIPGLQ